MIVPTSSILFCLKHNPGHSLSQIPRFNDTFGHPRGDAVLKSVARILKMSRRATDILCRVGGDAFAIIMPGISNARGQDVAVHIRNRIDMLTKVEPNRDMERSASLGEALHATAERPGELVARVDRYLYQAKRNGRNQVIWKEMPSGRHA